MTNHKNPMHSRCGLEDCDCEYTIERLEWLVEMKNKGLLWYSMPTHKDCLGEECVCMPGRALALTEADWPGRETTCPLCYQPSPDGGVHQECADREQCWADSMPPAEREF